MQLFSILWDLFLRQRFKKMFFKLILIFVEFLKDLKDIRKIYIDRLIYNSLKEEIQY